MGLFSPSRGIFPKTKALRREEILRHWESMALKTLRRAPLKEGILVLGEVSKKDLRCLQLLPDKVLGDGEVFLSLLGHFLPFFETLDQRLYDQGYRMADLRIVHVYDWDGDVAAGDTLFWCGARLEAVLQPRQKV